MDTKYSENPRSVRARKALQQGLLDLLKIKAYKKITVTDIVNQAELARHTFYNHYETKDELLDNLIDAPLDKLFSFAAEIDFYWRAEEDTPLSVKQLLTKFFKIWQEYPEIAAVIDSIDMDSLLIKRMRKNFEIYMSGYSEQAKEDIHSPVGQYVLCHNAYAIIGVLRQWLRNDMRHTPEEMAEFLDYFSSIRNDVSAIGKFKDVII